MTKSCREHRPLLCDDYSDEELDTTSPKFQRRIRYSNTSGRAKTQARGATAILIRWPEHLSSVLSYWWLGLGMIAVLIFIIYNSFVAIAILPPTHMRPAKILNPEHNLLNETEKKSFLPNIFMHIFVTSNDDLNINDHLTYIEPFSKKYSAFQKNFIIVINDVTDDIISISDEMRNEIALNTLLSDSKNVERQTVSKNITFKIISLTKYMDESPIKKYWRRLPQQFIKFLIRCIAIWDKGGIAFNPEILTSNSSSPVYIDKIHTFLNKYIKLNKTTGNYLKKSTRKKKKKVNNIRDIIDNLESDDRNNQIQYNLSEAENRLIISNVSYHTKKKRDTKFELLKINNDKYSSQHNNNKLDISKQHNKSNLIFIPKQHYNMIANNSQQKILPMFLKYLFRENPKNLKVNISSNDKKYVVSKPGTKLNDIINTSPQNNNRTTKSTVSSYEVKENFQSANPDTIIDNSRLTVDLKGNLIATDTSCHAFIGSVFSNAIHHSDEESVTDFIIKELSMFCKGILSSCNGVDVILL